MESVRQEPGNGYVHNRLGLLLVRQGRFTEAVEVLEQLKRLRDHQEEILRDTDELGERMDREENQERMADARQDLQNTRERIRQATEALKEGQVPQAVTSGTRAERELKELREEFTARDQQKTVQGQFDAYVKLRPDLRVAGTEDRRKMQEEYKALVEMGQPQTKGTELLAMPR